MNLITHLKPPGEGACSEVDAIRAGNGDLLHLHVVASNDVLDEVCAWPCQRRREATFWPDVPRRGVVLALQLASFQRSYA